LFLQPVGDRLTTAELGRDIGSQRLLFISPDKTIHGYIDGRGMAHLMLNLLKLGMRGEAYNVDSDQRVSMLEMATTIRAAVGIDQPIEVGDPDEWIGLSFYLSDIAKAGYLGLWIVTPLREALSQTVRALQWASRPNQLTLFPLL
jgi:nucleoside-diphosphate-sugar epimerase